MRFARRSVAAIAGVAALALGAPAQAASYYELPPSDSGSAFDGALNMSVRLSDAVKVARGGWSATWEWRVSCPAGEAFAADVLVSQLRSPLAPDWLFGEDFGVPARGLVEGVCTGREQRVVVPLTTLPTPNLSPEGGEALLIPLATGRPAREALSYATHLGRIEGDGFSASWCTAPACASITAGTDFLGLK